MNPSRRDLYKSLLIGVLALVVLGFLLGPITEEILEFETVVRLDQFVLDHTVQVQSRFSTAAMMFLSKLGGGILLWPIIVISVFLFVRWGRRFEAGFLSAVATGGIILDQFLKFTLRRARPVPPSGEALTSAWGWSYPSGHVMLAALFYFTLAYFILRHSERVRGWVAYGGAALVSLGIAVSRVYLQVHYLTDVVAGFVGGLLWFLVCALLARRWKPK